MPRHWLTLLVAGILSACTSEVVTWENPSDTGSEEDGTEPQSRDEDDEDRREGSEDDEGDGDDADGDDDERDVEEDRREVSGIPAGQMPPPASCRIWFPERSPGHQPPAGPCDELRDRVPDGAWLLYRPTAEPRVYRLE